MLRNNVIMLNQTKSCKLRIHFCHTIKRIRFKAKYLSKFEVKMLYFFIDCGDKHKSCNYWKKTGYCAIKKGFPHVITVCPLSCGRCVLCPTKKPNTALPPTKEEAEAAARNSIVSTNG